MGICLWSCQVVNFWPLLWLLRRPIARMARPKNSERSLLLAAAADSVVVPRNGSCVGEGEGEGGWSFSQCGRGKIYEAGDHRSRGLLLLSLLLRHIAFFEHKRQQRGRKGQKRKMVQLDLFRPLSLYSETLPDPASPLEKACALLQLPQILALEIQFPPPLFLRLSTLLRTL